MSTTKDDVAAREAPSTEAPQAEVPAKEVTPLQELKGIGRTLQEAGLSLLQAASNAVGAVAKDTLTATNAVIKAAEDTLDTAREKLREVGEEMKKKD